MPDIFDNFPLHLMTIMLIAFKITAFLTWSWWLICAPSIIAFALYIMASVMSR